MAEKRNNSKLAIYKVARIHDRATNSYLEVIKFNVSESEHGTLELAPSIVNDLYQLEKQLRDAGAILPKEKEELARLLIEVASSDAPEERVYEIHTGWIEDKSAFVTINGIVGAASRNVVGIKRSSATDYESGRLSASGSWKAWRDGVAMPALHSSIMMFAICVAFAAPLLALVKWPGFAICLFARTRVGKSVATLMAASVPGIGRLEDLITWNIKDARLEQRLAEYNDTIFPIDDFMGMPGNYRQKYLRIRDIAYKLAQGWAIDRHDSFTRAHGGVQEHWRNIVLTSYEKSIRDLARSVKLERQHGEALRLIDVPAIFDGLDHIFDRLPAAEMGNFQDWKKNSFEKIANACDQNHGKAFKKHIKSLITHRNVEVYIRAKIAYFVNHVCDQFDGDVARDVAAKFGLIYAGGRLGIRCGLLPWDKGDLLAAIAKCYFGARGLLPDDGVALREGISALDTRLRELVGISRLPKHKNSQAEFDKADGYRRRQPRLTQYIIKREVFNAVFASSTQKTLVIDWLIENQRITLAVPIASVGAAELKPKEQFIWPDGVRRRSYEIFWPRNEG
jgi:hypothetical protein